MLTEARDWWEKHAAQYQRQSQIPIDILYGPGAPNEDRLQLIGDVRGKAVLEIGCGAAQAAIAFARRGARVTALDVAESSLQLARSLATQHGVSIRFLQGDMADLSGVAPASQDVVFSACAMAYVDDLPACFTEVHRVLVPGGLFVWSIGHPFQYAVDSKTLALHRSYFDTGRHAEGPGPGDVFASMHRTVAEYFNAQAAVGFVVEQVVEPDSRIRYPEDPWYGLWDCTPALLEKIPGTIVFRARKQKA